MNICLVLAGNEEGGLETHVVDLANGLARLGDDVTVVAHARYGRALHRPYGSRPWTSPGRVAALRCDAAFNSAFKTRQHKSCTRMQARPPRS